jgi:RNA polymerase sigma-B factor
VPVVGEERRRLIEAHLPLARRLALRYAGRGEPTDELTQVGALALIRAVDRCDPSRAELPAYLARCVDGEIRHHLRDHASVVRVPRDAPRRSASVLPIDDELADGAELDDVLLERAALALAARRLDARERRIVLLVFFCGRTQCEVATELGLSQPQVSRLLSGALEKMRRQLSGHDALSVTSTAATLSMDGDGRRQVDGHSGVVA